LLTMLCPWIAFSQVTTSSMTGIIKNAAGEPLEGATVTATYVPTSTIFRVQTRAGGHFDLTNLPPGGPYTIEATFVNLSPAKRTDIYLNLGDNVRVDLVLETSEKELTQVVITGRSRVVKSGTNTNISTRQLTDLPNSNRSIMDITKITPQSNGTSFAGMNNRYNNITVDGSIFNNNFGLGGSNLPGGGAQPISIDAVDQIQVNLAPYDVRQAGFTGAGINAVTKRGTNSFTGTVYDYYRNQSFNGSKVADRTLTFDKSSSNIVGAAVGGPIIRNKLFFFINAESDRKTSPGQHSVALRPDNADDPNVVSTQAADLDRVRDYVKSTYNVDLGGYEGYNFKLNNTKFLARLDWNINSNHRLTVRYNQAETSQDNLVNAASGPNPRPTNSRQGGSKNAGLAYITSNYVQNNNVYSGVVELNSKFGNDKSNQLLASYTKQHDFRSTPGSQFPFVDIMNGGSFYISLGSELFSYLNDLANETWNVADNFTWNLGKHSVVAGVSYDFMNFANSFSNYGGPSYYRYASIDDFLNNNAPTLFAVTYSNSDRTAITPATAKFAQFGIYAQDDIAMNDKFRLTVGLRADLPSYPADAKTNKAVKDVVFKDLNGNPIQFDLGQWPKARLLVSPRIGFSYDVEGDRNLIVRGGTGIFTGRIPFVWLVNQSSDNGVLNTLVTIDQAAALANIRFDPDRTKHIPTTLPEAGTSIPPGFQTSVTASDFRMPQVWRSNIAVDKRIAQSWVLTFEGIYSKTINNVFHWNANLGDVKGNLNGVDNRPLYNRRLNTFMNEAVVMDNTSKGYSFSLTAQVHKTFSKNWEASVAYTYAQAANVTESPGDRSVSAWSTNGIVNNPNQPELAVSSFATPHRINANASYRIEYLNKNMATTIGIYYNAQAQDRYYFKYENDLNGDGATNDLIFIPSDPSQVTFEDYKNGNTVVSTAQQGKDAFFAFIENNSYLRKHKGQYMERFGALLPWVHSLDLRVLQDFVLKTGSKRHTLQLSVDFNNFLNLLNKSWGNRYAYNFGSFNDQGLLRTRVDASNNVIYSFNPKATSVYSRNYSLASTWNAQIGVRYIFK
jgi:hypothetical protein